MSRTLKFLFDECLGKPLVDQLRTLCGESADRFASILDRQAEGVADEEWIPLLAAEGDWIVLSADRGKIVTRGAKLPNLCREYKITHVLLSAKVHRQPAMVKLHIFATIWPKLVEKVESAEPGERFVLRYFEMKNGLRIDVVSAD